MKVYLGVLLLVLHLFQGKAEQWNVHLKVAGAGLAAVQKAWAEVTRLAPHNLIDLSRHGKDQAHVTLYLADFALPNLPRLPPAVEQLIQPVLRLPLPCPLTLTHAVASGDYLMWNVANDACLQKMSNMVVLAAYQLRNTSASIPDWVLALPDPPRSEMVRLFEEYGSPSVFSQFAPHVTLAYDTVDNLSEVLQQLRLPQNVQFEPKELAIGRTGIGGSVISGQDMATFMLPSN
jgi:hypothetical protein